MTNPSLIESSTFFFNQSYSFIVYFLKHVTSFWWLIFFFIDKFFRLGSVVCKKYTNANGNDSKDTNAIDII